jgi:hypothetical protein
VTLDELLAREGIRKTMARYTNAGDNGDYDDLIGCYAEDGIFEVATGRWEGRAAILAALRSMAAARSHCAEGTLQRHLLGTCHIVMEAPDRARSNTYFAVISEIGLDHFGRYEDRHVLRDGEWQFAHRRVPVEWRHERSRFARSLAVASASAQPVSP